MVFDSAGNVYLVGNTLSPNFPTTSGSYNENYSGAYPTGDAFISKMDNDLKTLVSSTFIGGTGDDNGYCIALQELPHPDTPPHLIKLRLLVQ